MRSYSPVLRMTEGQLTVRLRPGAERLGQIGQKANSHFLTNVVFPTGKPGLVRNAYGRGCSWYFAGTPGRQFYCDGQNNVKRLMKGLLSQAAGETAPVWLEAPDTVASALRQGAVPAYLSAKGMASDLPRELQEWAGIIREQKIGDS